MADIEQKGIGEELQTARIAKGLSLDDIQAQTKIQKRYLQAIENDQFDQLPGSFYERAFTRQYAAVVGLDAEDLLERHALDTKAPAEETKPIIEHSGMQTNAGENISRAGMRQDEAKRVKQANNMLPKVIMGVAAIAIVVVIWALVANFAGHSNNTSESSNVSVSSSVVSKSSSKESSAEKSSASSKEEPKTEIGAPAVVGNISRIAVKVPATGERKLTLVGVNGDSWNQVKSNTGAVLYSGTVHANETKEIAVDNTVTEVSVQIGNANNLKLQFNGEDVKLNNTSFVWQAVLNITAASVTSTQN
ncbi:helix-turn-helix domain-containing protein [Weissella kandleri]|uniref:helix-turn-helix domain-containing protein n=1 Tax=Weissella kandleri TaxID=1616 RepID=UPI00387EDD74